MNNIFAGVYEKEFSMLYKKTSTGAIQQWQISVKIENSPVIITNFGQVNGKIQESREFVLEGKNAGKANATTAWEQAILQAESTWKKQLKKGYVQSYDDALAGKTDDIIEGGYFPMLAHKFSEHGHKIKYPALAQPKLDGHRCVSDTNEKNVRLWSRTRKPIKSVPHIIKAIEDSGIVSQIDRLDGELYNHEYHDKFEELSSLIRQDEPADGYENIQYHVYDFQHPTMTNIERSTILALWAERLRNTPIHIVETIVVNNEDELMEAFEHFLELEYEGCMVRNCDGLYANKRSYDLQKIKNFDDDEFKIIGVKVGTKGSMAGKAVFTCEMKDGKTFDCKMKGSLDELERYANNHELVINKIVTVKYQGLTKYGIPRFPVALRFREDI